MTEFDAVAHAEGDLTRRGFLRVSTLGSAAVVFGGASLLTACDPVGLMTADANGVRVHPFFKSRVVATTGVVVPGTNYPWHLWPDGGACFALPDGGWSYVSNSEWFVNAGAGFLRFDATGDIVDAGSILTGTQRNCAGGKTPWGTWLSCEEILTGAVWECDPIGATPAVRLPLMGLFNHEAAACDEVHEVIYLTEDRTDGALYRFVPETWGDLTTGQLQVLTEPASGPLAWVDVPDPDGAPVETKDQVPDTRRFNGGEGIDMSGGKAYFTTKGDNRVWCYDPDANTLAVIHDPAIQVNSMLSGVDNLVSSDAGVLYVAEDGGDMQIVLVRPDGSTFPVVQVTGVANSEMCGPAFSPDGTRLYFSSQRNPGTTYEVTGPWSAFNEPGPFNP